MSLPLDGGGEVGVTPRKARRLDSAQKFPKKEEPMPTYRLGEGANAQGWPYLRGGHAYLADGMPLTEADPYGRVKPAQATLAKSKATCSGGLIGLADRQNGIER